MYSVLIEFGTSMKLVRFIEMSLNENYSKVCIGKNLSDAFPIQNGLKEDDLSPLLFNFASLNVPLKRSKKMRKEWN
jgi:hypothetical protein